MMGVVRGGLSQVAVRVDAAEGRGAFEAWRHALSHGGINTRPLPARVAEGVARLRPRLIRAFLQEHFAIYPARGRFDWRLLDPFLEALASTGAEVVACICIKPPVLYPTIDHSLWRPTDWREWQRVIRELVGRYSVERPIVSYWEIGNETDIGESGGCPYLIPDPKDYFEYYRHTMQAVLEACPSAKVGGPAACWVENEPLPGLVRMCRESGTRLDFISWHLYSDDPGRHASGVEKAKGMLSGWPGRRPEMLVTEWSKSFDAASYQDLALEPRRAAATAACVLAMLEAGVDWSFYYHIWDQVFYPEPFRAFFSPAGIKMMERHWNEMPHRFGLFGVDGEVRPQYFVYQMLGRMGGERVAAQSAEAEVRVVAARDQDKVRLLLVNYAPEGGRDVLSTVEIGGLRAGAKRLTVDRLDGGRRWDEEALEMRPLERRHTHTGEKFEFQVLLPADSVAAVTLEDADG